jgi:hypothetical protein
MNWYYDLTKEQKKTARRVIDKGLGIQYERALADAEEVCEKWREGGYPDSREAYMSLVRCVKENDENIAWIYNGKGGGRWVELMSLQLAIGVITRDDLNDFDEEVRNTIIKWSQPDL